MPTTCPTFLTASSAVIVRVPGQAAAAALAWQSSRRLSRRTVERSMLKALQVRARASRLRSRWFKGSPAYITKRRVGTHKYKVSTFPRQSVSAMLHSFKVKSRAWHPLALIRLTNAAAQLPYGSGETKGEGVPLHLIFVIAWGRKMQRSSHAH